jgi:aldose 1-epimerase
MGLNSLIKTRYRKNIMFEIVNKPWLKDHEEILIFDSEHKFFISILPQLGGMLNAYSVNGVNVIDGISLDQDGIDDYFSTFKSSVLLPYPNRISDAKFDFNGKEHRLHCNEENLNNALHGFIYNKTFKIIDSNCDADHGMVLLQYVYEGGEEGFPYPFEVTLEYNFYISGRLTCKCGIKNVGKETMPLGIGWHQYFSFGDTVDDLSLTFSPDQQLKVNEKMIPTGEKVAVEAVSGKIGNSTYDDCFTLKGHFVSLKHPELGELIIDCGQDYPFLQFYTPPHRRSIAIEPMTCPPNVFNNREGLIELKPGISKETSFSMTITH